MRKFSSLPSSGQAYGPVDTELHYYVPREALIEQAYTQLIGENPDEGGHYITSRFGHLASGARVLTSRAETKYSEWGNERMKTPSIKLTSPSSLEYS